jgi:type I restriction enzyme S subunit
MSLPRYSNYKDSGVEWLGEVPEHWHLRRLGFFFEERREKVSDKEFQPLSVTKNGIVPQLETAAKTDDGENRKKVCKGDFVINSRSDRKGSSGLSVLDGSVSLISTVLRPGSEAHGAYVHHLLRSESFQEEFYRYGKGIVADLWSTNYSEMRNITMAIPRDIGEQAAIATFLDREVTKIDALISEQEKLIKLLAEKRQATISHAVTKGLNLHAPMKDSGVEWLGEVPEHWSVTRLKYAMSHIVDCPHDTPVYNDDGVYQVIRTADISLGRFHADATYRVDEGEYLNRIRRLQVMRNDIVYGREGERWGFAALVPENGRYCLGQRMMQFRAREEICANFMMWQLNAVSTYRQGQMDTVGATAPHVNVGTIRNYRLTEPPLDEQIDIADFLAEETEKLDAVANQASLGIRLLIERRSALISAAVTGKIDVRQVVQLEHATMREAA